MSPPRTVTRIVSALATTIVLSFIALQQTNADIGRFIPTWRMIGHDITNTRSQPFEPRISGATSTASHRGGRSPPPAMSRQHPRSTTKQTRNGDAAIDASSSTSPTGAGSSGNSTPIPAKFSGRATSLNTTASRIRFPNEPCAGARHWSLVADLNGNMMGIDASDRRSAAGSPSSIPIPTRSSRPHRSCSATALYCDLVLRWRATRASFSAEA